MSLSASRTRLVAITKDLRRNWESARGAWRDEKCIEFDQLFMSDIESSVNTAVTVMQELEDVIQQVKKDCE
ncbi:MAG: hypothetical protein CMO80_12215 [Verrucomicrobiales bacterium]|nr:hypothetical protein [Verrucomicrobiales bacterium]|tara:strand:- start:122 stop:334 length:213 start_codon:yes stop_codon:yes gene_type:complete